MENQTIKNWQRALEIFNQIDTKEGPKINRVFFASFSGGLINDRVKEERKLALIHISMLNDVTGCFYDTVTERIIIGVEPRFHNMGEEQEKAYWLLFTEILNAIPKISRIEDKGYMNWGKIYNCKTVNEAERLTVMTLFHERMNKHVADIRMKAEWKAMQDLNKNKKKKVLELSSAV